MATPSSTTEGNSAEKLRRGLGSSRKKLTSFFSDLILGPKKIEEDFFRELEGALLSVDIGPSSVNDMLESLVDKLPRSSLSDPKTLLPELKRIMVEKLSSFHSEMEISSSAPHIVFFVGVNGAGKTTTIGKLAERYSAKGKSILLAAGDTFRAAAVDQLSQWAERSGAQIVSSAGSSDSASVIYDAIQKAQSAEIDLLLVDTAGRLQANSQLMDELKKVKKVTGKLAEGGPHDIVLVIDGSAGQNVISQVAEFDRALGLTGLVVTKLDGGARGGVIFSIESELDVELPIFFVGVGESKEDLLDFNPLEYVEALLPWDDF